MKTIIFLLTNAKRNSYASENSLRSENNLNMRVAYGSGQILSPEDRKKRKNQ
jgi:hypothetical protein